MNHSIIKYLVNDIVNKYPEIDNIMLMDLYNISLSNVADTKYRDLKSILFLIDKKKNHLKWLIKKYGNIYDDKKIIDLNLKYLALKLKATNYLLDNINFIKIKLDYIFGLIEKYTKIKSDVVSSKFYNKISISHNYKILRAKVDINTSYRNFCKYYNYRINQITKEWSSLHNDLSFYYFEYDIIIKDYEKKFIL